MQFRRDFLGTEFFDRPEFRGVAQLLDAAVSGLAIQGSVLAREPLKGIGELPPPERTLALLRLLIRLADAPCRALSTREWNRSLSRPATRRVDMVCAYLQENFTRPVQLADVAAVAHMSPAALSRLFRQALGRTLTDYVTELRVAAACQLLSDTDLPIADVATRSGYDNLSNFNRRFRRLKHTSPSQYRKIMAGASETHCRLRRYAAGGTPVT